MQEVEQPKSFLKTLKKPEFTLIVLVFCMFLIRSEFFTKSNKDQLKTTSNQNLYSMFSILNILSFIPGPFFGKLTDKIGILWIVLILNSFGLAMYAFIMFDTVVTKGIGLICFFMYTSFCLSNLYCYINVVFAPQHFGKLTGIASMIGGLWSLSSIGWYNLSTGTLISWKPNNFLLVDGLMICFGVISMILWIIMFRLNKKQKAKSHFFTRLQTQQSKNIVASIEAPKLVVKDVYTPKTEGKSTEISP